MNKIASLNGYGDPHKEGENEKPEGPYTQRNRYFRYVRHIFINFTERIGDEAGYDKAETLLNPHAHDDEKRTDVERKKIFSGFGNQENDESRYVHE